MWFRNLDKILTRVFQLLAVFMLAEAVYHASGWRLAGVEQYWPASAILFARLFLTLWASASLVLSLLFWHISRNIIKYQGFLGPMMILMVGHSLILYYFSFQHLETVFETSSLYVHNPYYSWQLRLEALSLDAIALLILLRKLNLASGTKYAKITS